MQLPSRLNQTISPPHGGAAGGSPDERAVAPVEPATTPASGAGAPLHFTPPTPRARRAQAVQRLQIGLFGLAAMLLLVSLANIIMQHARQSEAAQAAAQGSALPVSGMPAHAAASAGTSGSDPLADIGVAPPADAGDHHPSAHTGH